MQTPNTLRPAVSQHPNQCPPVHHAGNQVSAGSAETARCYKPEPRIFQQACDALSVPAGQAVMAGDTPETDIHGAQRAGLRAVWLNRGHRGWPGNLDRPDAVI